MPDPDRASGDFVRVLAAEGMSNFGSMLSRLAIPFLATLALAATPMQMSLLLVADVLAGALGSLLLGGLVDRSGKRAVMLACDVLRATLLAMLALSAWSGHVGMLTLVAASAASGVLTMGFELARSAWIAQCIATRELPRRNAQLSMTGSLSETAAFALGGWLYQGLGAALSLAVDALSYLISALCLAGVREVRALPGEPDPRQRQAWSMVLDDARTGLRTVVMHSSLRALAGVEVLVTIGMSMFGTCFMIYVSRDLGLPTGPLGVIFALGGLGAVVGGVLATRFDRRFGSGPAMTAGLAMLALGSAFAPMATQAGWLAVALLVAQQIVGDCGHTVHDVHDRTLRQTLVPPPLLARADAGIRSAGQVGTLTGALLGGVLGTLLGPRAVLAIATLCFAIASLVALLKLAPRHRAH